VSKTAEEYRAIAEAQSQHQIATRGMFRETDRQLVKWGIQDWPAGNDPERRLLQHTDINLDLRTGSELEHIFRERCEAKAKEGTLTYFDILLEEVFEAGGAGSPEEFEKEMEQVGAVAASAIAASKRARGA
jgi:hypothetical protein